MFYEVHIYENDDEREMTSGAVERVEALSPLDAVVAWIRANRDFDEGTKGRADYEAAQSVEAGDDDVSASAYRCGDAWEVHVYIDDRDVALTLPA